MNKIAVLYDAGQAVLSTFDLDEVLQRILAIAHDYFHLRNVAIVLLDKQSQQLYVRSQIGWDEGQDKVRFPLGQGIREPRRSRSSRSMLPTSARTRAISAPRNPRGPKLAIPLMVRDEVVGVLDCQSDRLEPFRPRDHRSADAFLHPGVDRAAECAAVLSGGAAGAATAGDQCHRSANHSGSRPGTVAG